MNDYILEAGQKALQEINEKNELVFKEMAEDNEQLRNALLNTEKHLQSMENESAKTWKITVANLVVVVLTLGVAVLSLVITVLKS